MSKFIKLYTLNMCSVSHADYTLISVYRASLVTQLVKNSPAMQETPLLFLGQENTLGKGWATPLQYSWTSLLAQMVNNLPAMRETWVWSLGLEDLLEEGIETNSSICAWRIPWTEEPGGLQSMGSQRVRHDWATEHKAQVCLENTNLVKRQRSEWEKIIANVSPKPFL